VPQKCRQHDEVKESAANAWPLLTAQKLLCLMPALQQGIQPEKGVIHFHHHKVWQWLFSKAYHCRLVVKICGLRSGVK